MWYVPPQTYTPHPYQRQASVFLAARTAALLFLDPGLGKTSITLSAIQRLRGRGRAKKVLVVAPLQVALRVWTDEVAKWKDFGDLRVEVLHGKHKDAALARDADIYVVNFDGLPWLLGSDKSGGFGGKSGKANLQRVTALGFDTLVIDEVSKLKHTASQRFRLLKPALPLFERRWGLTGSPAANGLEGVFGQAYAVDLGATFGPYITAFRQKYFMPAWFGGFEIKLQPDGAERIHEALAPLALRMAAEDYLALPEVFEHAIHVELPPAARKAYDALERDLLVQLGRDLVTASTAAVALNKCRQVASGGVYVDQEAVGATMARRAKVATHIHDAKTDALEDLLDELQGQQVLVTYEYSHDLDRMRKRLGKDLPVIGGDTSAKAAGDIIDKWNAGKIRLLLGHPASMGHGLNLQGSGCAHICHYTPTWDYELFDQVNRRILRQGTTAKRMFVHTIVARDTVDEVVIRVLKAKGKSQHALFDALKNYRKGINR